jgi:hypothetical protein
MQLANLLANMFWLLSIMFAAISWVIEMAGLIATQSVIQSSANNGGGVGTAFEFTLSTGWWSWVLQLFVIGLIVVSSVPIPLSLSNHTTMLNNMYNADRNYEHSKGVA